MLVPVACLSFEEIARSICAVDFEPLILGYEATGLIPSQIMQDCSYCMDFEITALELGGPCCDDGAEEPRSHAVVVSEVIKMLAAKSESFGYQWGVGDLNTGQDSSWRSRHCVKMQVSAYFPLATAVIVEAAQYEMRIFL